MVVGTHLLCPRRCEWRWAGGFCACVVLCFPFYLKGTN